MNVLFVINGNEPYVSQQAQIELISGLQKKGVSILVIGNIFGEVEANFKSLRLPFLRVFPEKRIDRNYIKTFKKILTEHSIELVHFIDGKSSRSGLIALKGTTIKVVNYFGSTSLHWYDPSSYLTYLHPRIDAIIGNSNHVYSHVKNQLFGKNKGKAVRIFKGYSSKWFDKVEPFDYSELNIPKDAIKVCFVGNHRKVKGTRYFLESSYHLSSKKEIHLIVIGEDTDKYPLNKITKKSPISERIHILGIRNDVVSLLKGCDIYVQTSLNEGFGRAISEAMSVGKPIIMTDAGGCTELVDEQSGIITPLKDSRSIAKAISKLADDDTLRMTMGEKAKERIDSVYHIDNTVNDTLNLYSRLLKK
ncbi:glycosyltransferase family 4 protein [Flavobacteriaceae bacterium S356]|uniref:Glycosyltransferase family 4 protein n=1 Tax=Asprobacillus argus TaxID=3076534 RepID=A0ABU3LH69_9FLAO|nr:glycosyltransferase family 4 protein [Flavobacteriaceae bacterium S356]